MAKHKSFQSLGKAITRISNQVDLNVPKAVRKAALVADQVLVITTPVQTGFARSRWTVSIGGPIGPENGPEERIDLGEEIATVIALSQGEDEIKKYRGKGSIFITNPLEYVIYLESGTSDQAPNGMMDEARNAAQDVLRALKLLI